MQTILKDSKPEISCIYVNYRSANWLKRSLQSLTQWEKGISYEVIIVNNDQNDQAELEKIQREFSVLLIPSFHNPGFGASANTGAEAAKGELLFFINPDTSWQQSFFPLARDRFAEQKSLGALGIPLVSPEGKKEAPEKKISLQAPFFQLFSNRPGYVWVSGGALFVRKEIFLQAGGFDERFFMYFEDMDLCVRLQKLGYQVGLAEEPQLIHYGGRSHDNKRSQKNLYDQSLYQYTKKHWPAFTSLLFRMAHPFYRFLFPYGRG